jgi:hypothetical protein
VKLGSDLEYNSVAVSSASRSSTVDVAVVGESAPLHAFECLAER